MSSGFNPGEVELIAANSRPEKGSSKGAGSASNAVTLWGETTFQLEGEDREEQASLPLGV